MSESIMEANMLMDIRETPPNKTSFIGTELVMLRDLITKRIRNSMSETDFGTDVSIPDAYSFQGSYAEFVRREKLTLNERLILICTLAPYIQPDFFDEVIQNELKSNTDFLPIGGIRGKNFRGFLPTGDTALFILAGTDINKRLKFQNLLGPEHFFARNQVLSLEKAPSGEPPMSGQLILNDELVSLFCLGKVNPPRFDARFPAQRIETELNWEDLVLPESTMAQIKDLELWVNYGQQLLEEWEMSQKLKKGYRALFYGPPGTGKTLTASLLGKYTKREVFRVDLSMVVSKFIGETEKNLSNLFDRAEHKQWILFFDEADALFGKRTNVKDAHDKYANQEVSYLLQRTENYNGLVILATNLKSNIDDAFSRRFQSHIYFAPPKYSERLILWKKAFPAKAQLAEDISLESLAKQYELKGAHIMNVVQYACLRVLARGETTIGLGDVVAGIKNEFSKEGKSV